MPHEKSVTVMLPTAPPEPMHRRFANVLTSLYIKRGMAAGHALDDWLQAEAELVQGHSTSDSN